jgi:signal transduction histidine kinase
MPGIPRVLNRRAFARYAAAATVVGASLLLQHWMMQGFGLDLPRFLLLYPAIVFVAVLAGLGPGLLATALAVLGTDYLILPLLGHAGIAKTADMVALVVFAVMGALISLLAEHYRRSQQVIATFQTEQALQKSEVLYQRLFNSMEEGFCIIQVLFDAEGKPVDYVFLEVNAAFEKQTGLQGATGKRMRELAPAHEAHWFELYGKVAMTGGPVQCVNEAKALNRFYDVRAYRVGEPEQRQVAIVFNDISVRQRAAEHIRQLNRVYTVLSDINQTIVRERDSQALLEAACRIAVEKGQFRMAWIGMIDGATRQLKPIAWGGTVGGYLERIRIDCDDPNTAAGPAVQCVQTGAHAICSDIEHELLRPWREDALENGYRSLAVFPLRREGRVIGVFGIYANEVAFFDEDEIQLLDRMAMDISYALEVNGHEQERRAAEEELRWRTAFFEAQVDSALDGVLVVDGRGRKILQNRRLNELLKIPQEIAEDTDDERQRRYLATLVKDSAGFEEKVNYLNAHQEKVSREELELLDGTILDRYSSPVRDKAGNYYGRIWTFRDITERRQMEEQFRQAQKMEAVGQLTGGIAHDFNNLLTVILGCAEVIGEGAKADPRVSRMAEMIGGAAQRGADLTRRMLAFARRQTLEPKQVNVNKLLEGMESFLRRTLSAEISLDVIQGSDACDATVDPTQLESAVLNLCVNARDAMPNGGKLTIETGSTILDADYAAENPEVVPGEYILIAVSDTGCGISQENLRRVFDPFFTTKDVGKGTGLGLSMVYGFVKESQGHIKIYSEPGHGTSVKIYLPQASQKSEPVEVRPVPVEDLRGSETILLVEDNDPVREFAKSQLVELGYRVLEATNGKDALEVIRAHRNIQLLFTDMVMPGGMNGRELAQEALKANPALKVLYSSGYAENAVLHQGLPDKVARLLSKPYTRQDLAKRIRGALSEK